MITPDYSEVSDIAFERLPMGRYCVRLFEFVKKDGSNGNPDYFLWKLKIFNNPKYNGRFVFYQAPWTGKFAWKTKTLLAAANSSYKGEAFEPQEYVGSAVEIDLNINSAGYEQVRAFYPFVESGSIQAQSSIDDPYGSTPY